MNSSAAQPETSLDLTSPDFLRNPYPAYERLRQADPVHRLPLGFLVLSRHQDISAVLRDKRFGKTYAERMELRNGPYIMDEPAFRSMSKWMMWVNPPTHTRLRGLVTKAFAARRIEDMRERIQHVVDDTIDRLAPRGAADLINDFAFALPVGVICDMLGIPAEDAHLFLSAVQNIAKLLDPVTLTRDEIDEANTHFATMADYFERLFDLRRNEPRPDLTSELIYAEENGSKLSKEELTANIIQLFSAGHETSVNLIGNGLLALHRHPDQLALLRNDPTLIGNAVEELLRYDSPVQAAGRDANEDAEIDGRPVAKGEAIVCLLGAGNRDPEAHDAAERLDIRRKNIRHLSFGGGPHYCIGAQLARIEAEVAVASLLRRLPNLTVDNLDAPDWRLNFVIRGLSALPAHW
ncbi:MAG: cytochrome P450 [Rhodospirillaceae bacterium]|nr:MAG: cytochrome P450 [Rhodospirillaceae bacterium]